MQDTNHSRSNRSATVSPSERIIVTVILWAATVGLAVIIADYLLAAYP